MIPTSESCKSSLLARAFFLLVSILFSAQSADTQLSTYSHLASSYAIQRWGNFDYASNLQDYIDHEQVRLKVISNVSSFEEEEAFVKQRLQEFKTIHAELLTNSTQTDFRKSFRQNHPLTVLAALRDFIATWESKLANKTVYGKRLKEFLEAKGGGPLPGRNELAVLGSGITVIQMTYNLSMSDLFKGQVMGHQGAPLTNADSFDIAHTALEAGLLDTATEWLETSISNIDLDKVDASHVTFNLSHALSILAKIAFKKNDQEKAKKLFEKAVEFDPENMVVYKDYLKHRFGRNVNPLTELDREKVETWRKKFYDICQNSSNSAWLAQQKAVLSSRLQCRLRAPAYAPYLVFKEEILSKSPYISRIYDFVSDREAEMVKNKTLSRLGNYLLPGIDKLVHWYNKGSWFKDTEHQVFKKISLRVGDVVGFDVKQGEFPVSRGEPIIIIDYAFGGLALPNGDFLKKYKPNYMNIPNGNRFATFQVYLTDVTVGGATVFIEQNITVIPKKGDAIFWYNYQPSGEPESTLFAATCPLAVGRNIVLEKGVWLLPNDTVAFCGRKTRSSHLTTKILNPCTTGKCRPLGSR